MEEKYDILFLGGLFPKEDEENIIKNSKGPIQNAANNLQWELVLGFDDNMGTPISVLNTLFVGSYPQRYKVPFINTYKFSHSEDAKKDINVGFLNLPLLKIFRKIVTVKPYIKQWANDNTNKKKIIIGYAMTYTTTKLLEYAKKNNSEIITCLIVPDLPKYMNVASNKSVLYDAIKKIEINKMKSNMKSIDSYVLLTKYMAEELGISGSNFVVVEGICTNTSDIISDVESINDNSIKTLLYTGTLAKKYGVVDLVNAFRKIKNDNYRLIICGSGDAEKYIVKASELDKRIIYKGQLQRKDILQLQKSSTVLINPRKNNEEYTKFSFPSKNIEYLSSGTPLIAYQLDGIPSEYLNYFYVVDETEDLSQIIDFVLSKSNRELKDQGEKARQFVKENKNRKIQTKKILDMYKKI